MWSADAMSMSGDFFDRAGTPDLGRPQWNHGRETMPPADMRQLQLSKLKTQVRYLADNSALYQRKFRECGFTPEQLTDINDLAAIPFTTKAELRGSQDEAPPFGLHQAAPMDRIVRITSTAGTTGKPVFQGYTASDVMERNESICRGLWGYGVRPGDRVINGFALSMFNAGVPFCTGIEHLGAVSVPVGAERKADGLLKIARDVRATVFIGTPSFAAYLAERAPDVLGFPLAELGVRVVCGGGESGFEIPSFRREMGRSWGTPHIYDWASSSDAHPNVFAECHCRNGKHHLTPDLVLVQLIDAATGAVQELRHGAEGEYIFSHLSRRACPLLRYRSGDILRVSTDPCECGRTGFRMDIIGRADDMLIVRGVNLFPSAVKSIVGEFAPDTSGKAEIVLPVAGPKAEPPVRVRIECGEGIDPASVGQLGIAIENRIRAELTVATRAELVPFGWFPRTETKTRLVVIESAAAPPERAA
jgi:phenylacetate-CoA ligase